MGSSGTILRTTSGGVVSVKKDFQSRIPHEFVLLANYPNPFNPSTTTKCELPKSSAVCLSVFDLLGHEVAVLVNETKAARRYDINVNAAGLASGAYVYRLEAGNKALARTMLLITYGSGSSKARYLHRLVPCEPLRESG